MALLDAAGKSHPGMFEEIDMPNANATAKAVSGRGHRTRMKATGPDAVTASGPAPYPMSYYGHRHSAPTQPPPGQFDTCTGNPKGVEFEARSQGAIAPVYPGESLVGSRRGRK